MSWTVPEATNLVRDLHDPVRYVEGQRTIRDALLNATTAYDALRAAGVAHLLPGLDNCEERLERALAIAEGDLAARIEALLPPEES